METAVRRQEEADDSVPFCTVFDPLRQFQLSQTSTCRRPSAFLAYAMSKASHLGDCLDGRILTHPLPGVPTPQACVHSIVHNDYLVIPVALGDGSFCTLSVHRRSSIFQLFEQLELRCGTPRSYRFLLQRGWLTCLINNAAVRDVMAADALLFADSARLERTPALLARESPARLEDAVPRSPTDTQSVFIHRPGFAPVSISATPLPFAAVEAHCVAHRILLNDGTLKTTCPTTAQVGEDQHLLALTFRQNQAPLDWMIVDLQHVGHPPLAQFWTAPLQLPFTVAGFADLLAGEFPTLPVIVGAFIADVDLELPQSSSQAPVVTAIGLPAEHSTTGGHTTSSTTMAIGDTTCTTTEPVHEGHGFQSRATECSHPSPSGAPVAIPSCSTSHGSSDTDFAGLQETCGSTGVQTAAASNSGGTQLAVSFDVLHHATIHCVPATATLAEVVALILHNSQHLAPPLAFRVMHGRFPWLPPVQLVVWSETLPGLRVIPIHMGDGDLDFCTVSVPVEASAFETAIHIALVRPEHDRLRYHIAHGSRILYADGQRTEPFLAWQLASIGGAIVSDQLPASMRPLAPPAPTNSIVPVHLTQERFTVQNREVMVRRAGRHDALVSADPSYGPQQLLTRLVEVVHAPGSARLSFPALMPVTDPCRLHVVLHPRSLPTSDMASCLLDLRRVTQPPVAPWQVVELPSLCVLSDVQAMLHTCCPPDTAYSAVYINYQRLSFHPVGVHRHTVVSVLGMQPQEGLDTVYRDGTFGPLCFRGNDVAATRPGLARFLAYPAHVSSHHFPTTSTTTAGFSAGPDSGECPQACPVASSIFTVFDTVHGVRTFTGDPDWSIAEVMHNAIRAAGLSFDAVPRRLQCELNCLPSPQILFEPPSD